MNLFGRLVGLLGGRISVMQGLYLHRTTQHRKTRTSIHAPSVIQTRDPSVRAAEDIISRGHWYRQFQCIKLVNVVRAKPTLRMSPCTHRLFMRHIEQLNIHQFIHRMSLQENKFKTEQQCCDFKTYPLNIM
jgi:hypothetical protein